MAKVLLIASQASSLLNFRGDLIAAMQQQGHHVSAIAPACDVALAEQLRAAGVDFSAVPMHRAGMNPIADFNTLRALFWQMRHIKPDIVLTYTIKPVIYGMLAARLAGVRQRFALITGLGYAFTESEPSFKRGLVRRVLAELYRVALAGAAGVIFQNPDDQAYFVGSKLVSAATPTHRVYGSGVNIAHYTPSPVPDAPIFIMIARLLNDKGVREYIAAARSLKATCPAARCFLAGPLDSNPSAITREVLDAVIAEGVIHYLGALADVRPAIADASVFVLPSYREGTPRSVLEAMAMGRAIITTDAPGCRETVVEGRNGILVPVRDAEALANAMHTLASDGAKRSAMGLASRALAEALYDVHKVNAQMLSIMGLAA